MDIENKINEVINYIRPYLLSEGGNVEFIKYQDGIVYIEMQGACANCELLDSTIKDTIEVALKDEIKEVKKVINISQSY